MTKENTYITKTQVINDKHSTMTCYPLHWILSAMQVTKVDYFSLDIEGNEFHVLKTIPFRQLKITVFNG